MTRQTPPPAPILIDVHLITCVVQRGRADRVVKAAMTAGAEGATIHYARGTGARQRMGILSMAINAEKEVITIAVSGEQRGAVFEAMSIAGELDTPGMGFMYITPVEQAATFIPADILSALASEALHDDEESPHDADPL
jgi:nitrogen regulatory protein PII